LYIGLSLHEESMAKVGSYRRFCSRIERQRISLHCSLLWRGARGTGTLLVLRIHPPLRWKTCMPTNRSFLYIDLAKATLRYGLSCNFFGGGDLAIFLEDKALGSGFTFLKGQWPDIMVAVLKRRSMNDLKWGRQRWAWCSSLTTIAPFKGKKGCGFINGTEAIDGGTEDSLKTAQ
jgi:hypothetical protein